MNPIFTLKHGGSRPGAGRPPTGNVTLNLRVKPETRKAISRMKGRWHTFGEVLDRLIGDLERKRQEAELARLLE